MEGGPGPHHGGFADKDEGSGFSRQCSRFPGNLEPDVQGGLQEHKSGSYET